jgi:hypothetical protein
LHCSNIGTTEYGILEVSSTTAKDGDPYAMFPIDSA